MPVHVDHLKSEPDAYKTLLAVRKYVTSTDIDPKLIALIDIRVSQINGCAFCLDKHIQEARHLGESDQRIDTLAAWRETPFFNPAERAALAFAECVTHISNAGVPESLAKELEAHFSEKQIVQLLMVVIDMNSWNRLGVATGLQPTLR